MSGETRYLEHVSGGGVPGGHYVFGKIRKDGRKSRPFITPTRETNSIPLRHTDVVVDLGAYVGTYAIRAARYPVRLVRAYEPTPDSAAVLRRSAMPNLEVIEAAVVGSEVGSIELNISAGIGVTNSIVDNSRKAGSIEVEAVSYSRAVESATIVKIDVEGGEYEYGELVRPSIRAFAIDFHPVGSDWVTRAETIVEELRDHGFRPIIAPAFDRSGWERAGSWIRELDDEPFEVHTPMLDGRECCGCGAPIVAKSKSLCNECWSKWSPRHRTGFEALEGVTK